MSEELKDSLCLSEEESSDSGSDGTPLKTTKKKFVLTPARRDALQKGRQKRLDYCYRLQELKKIEKEKNQKIAQEARIPYTQVSQKLKIAFL